MEETGLSAPQAIDGNDFQSTHIVAYSGSEPIGATRIRWFCNFAKIERTAFRPAYRSVHTLKECCNFIFDHVARKGYDTLVTHAEPKYARLWERALGFEQVKDREPVMTAGQEPYVELVKRLLPKIDAITLETDPRVLFRVEGEWDTPGAFDHA